MSSLFQQFKTIQRDLLVRYFDIASDVIISLLKTTEVPHHVGFIMDGNRRWARARGMGTSTGHKSGATALLKTLNLCFSLGVEEVSVYALSIENFSRPKEEVDGILEILDSGIDKLVNDEEMKKFNFKIRIVGNRTLLAPETRRKFEETEAKYANGTYLRSVNICLPYTSRDDITHAMRAMSLQRAKGIIRKDEITELSLGQNFYFGKDSRPLDILVRTSGHQRLSDFMIWQCSDNCTVAFINALWPDFNFIHLYLVVITWCFDRNETIKSLDLAYIFGKRKAAAIPLSSLPPSPPFTSIDK